MIRRGVSLIETVVYVGIVAIILAALVTFSVDLFRQHAKTTTIMEVEQNARFAIEKISAAVRSARDATLPAPGANGSTLSLTMGDTTVSPTEFRLSSGMLERRQGTGSWVRLTASSVIVTSLTFRNLLDPDAMETTDPTPVQCPPNQNKQLVCHGGGTLCINDSALPAHLEHSDTVGPCFPATTAKGSIRIELTVTDANPASAGNEYQSSMTVYDTATIRRQN